MLYNQPFRSCNRRDHSSFFVFDRDVDGVGLAWFVGRLTGEHLVDLFVEKSDFAGRAFHLELDRVVFCLQRGRARVSTRVSLGILESVLHCKDVSLIRFQLICVYDELALIDDLLAALVPAC